MIQDIGKDNYMAGWKLQSYDFKRMNFIKPYLEHPSKREKNRVATLLCCTGYFPKAKQHLTCSFPLLLPSTET